MARLIFSIFVFAVLIPVNVIAQTLVYDNEAGGAGGVDSFASVSYTHLTLPTICSV